jgi:hypothetical protein
MSEVIINYKQLLEELDKSNQECHLLLGNGFNNSLGVNTSYKGIFAGMKREYKGYEELETFMNTCNYDIEKLIDKLKKLTTKSEDLNESFLPDFIESKVKFDFMKSAYDIVKNEMKGIYHEDKNKGIYLLFKNFTNYFSLNYDPLLYLILMKFKKSDGDNEAVGLQNSLLFKQEDMNQKHNDIYAEIQKARKSGILKITIGDTDTSENSLKNTKKNDFQVFVRNHFKAKGWKNTDIERVCNKIWEEESSKEKLSIVNDSFAFEEYDPSNSKIQNIFFLHGAFHLYQDKKIVRKITQSQDKALYQKLEEIINSEEKDIICVLTGTTEEKKKAIDENIYLKNSFEKLSKISGYLVIFGSSLDENDCHIFNQINESSISKIYISGRPDNLEKDSKKAKKAFPKKEFMFFDYQTVSYNS